jgi:uncharacterized NAD(P)/FAD-binding protein YdhS
LNLARFRSFLVEMRPWWSIHRSRRARACTTRLR